MFEGQKYITRGIQEEVGIDIQIILWKMIEELRQKKDFNLDYLQVFDLETIEIDGSVFQKITHKQEVEPYSNTIIIKADIIVDIKIFVISSDNEYSTMMLAKEY